jgi:hypothetical protein
MTVADYDGTPEHRLRQSRKQSGMTPILPTRPYYATTGSCSCGQWKSRDNRAPSKGGRRAIVAAHKIHVQEMETR